MKLGTCLVAALLIAASTSLAEAADGLMRNSAAMRAGPGPGFPQVSRIPAGARVTIHGCLEGGAWCDVSFAGERGWVASRALAYLYREQYVYLPEYVEYVPVAPFVLTTYWSSFYFGRPWFYRHAYWNRYWRQHPPVMAQTPTQPGTTLRGPHPVGTTQPVAAAAGMPAAGRAGSAMAATPAQTARPASIAQPSMGRLTAPAQGAHAQMGGMGAMMASAPRFSAAAPRGGGRSGSGGGFRRH
ncbi:SH3 domain-containing protein [Bradyrhizobium sp. STM 3809]|uniref:SH3 domain-containing protein n=1 Tax=Bradyrhizobium sp. STM 3809 TaxID=551936 RepID=UPI001F0AD7FD|nr:SH3 domain-containing protein [Bradyrhizobium sp. STM 3809]